MQTQNSTLGWRSQFVWGAVLAVMAIVAVTVDVLNNFAYGLTVSPMMAAILVLAAIAVVAIPAVASVLGWDQHLKLALTICVALTVWSAVNAYTKEIGADILHAQASQDNYIAAKTDANRARDVLKSIVEVGDAGELGTMLAKADKDAKQYCDTQQYSKCKRAEGDQKSLRERLSLAKTRDEAKAELAKAEGKSTGGPAEPSMLATLISQGIGCDAASVARYLAMVLTGFGIAVTQLVALFGGKATGLITGAFLIRSQKPEEVGIQVGVTNVPLKGNIVSFDAVRLAVQGWIDKATIMGSEFEMRGGDARKSFERWYRREIDAKQFQSLLSEMLPSGSIIPKTSGYTVRGLALREKGGETVAN